VHVGGFIVTTRNRPRFVPTEIVRVTDVKRLVNVGHPVSQKKEGLGAILVRKATVPKQSKVMFEGFKNAVPSTVTLPDLPDVAGDV
jgi:hypothetical protein